MNSNQNTLATKNGRTPFEAKLIYDGQATQEQVDRARKESRELGTPFISTLEEIIGQLL